MRQSSSSDASLDCLIKACISSLDMDESGETGCCSGCLGVLPLFAELIPSVAGCFFFFSLFNVNLIASTADFVRK